MRLLFLENNEEFLQPLVLSLKQRGHSVDTAAYVDEAKRLFRDRPYDAIVCDIAATAKRGGPSSGLSFIEYVRNRKASNIPVVLTSGINIIGRENLEYYKIDLLQYKPLAKGVDPFIVEIEDLVRR